MTDRRVSEDTAILGSAVATGDLFDLVDVSDTTDASSGTNKKITADEAAKFFAANANLTGAFDAAGAASTAQSTAEAYADSAVATHSADTTSVHGITDTSVLETTTGSQAKADAKVSDTAYDATSWNGVTTVAPSKNAVRDEVELLAPKASPALTGTPTAPTPTAADNSTKIATTAYVDTADALKAPLASPALTGSPTAPTQTANDNSTKIATTAYADGSASTAAAAKVSDTAYDATSWDAVTTVAPSKNAVRDKIELLAPLASPSLTGNPTAPTASVGDNDTSIATTAYVHGEIGSSIQAFDSHYLKSNTSVQLTAGFDATDHAYGTISSGTVTPVPSSDGSNFGTLTNNGAFTLAVPTNSTSVVIEVTNGASAGTITTSGYTKVNGDSYDTTSAHKFIFWITKAGSSSVLTIKALQ